MKRVVLLFLAASLSALLSIDGLAQGTARSKAMFI